MGLYWAWAPVIVVMSVIRTLPPLLWIAVFTTPVFLSVLSSPSPWLHPRDSFCVGGVKERGWEETKENWCSETAIHGREGGREGGSPDYTLDHNCPCPCPVQTHWSFQTTLQYLSRQLVIGVIRSLASIVNLLVLKFLECLHEQAWDDIKGGDLPTKIASC